MVEHNFVPDRFPVYSVGLSGKGCRFARVPLSPA
jgi:hypothetical protein